MAQLAIQGGPKTVSGEFGSRWPVWDDRERTALLEVLESGKWGRGAWDFHHRAESRLVRFEQAFARYNDMEYGLAVSTGTAALECALVGLGVQAGDEVIVPAATYIASAACAAQVNAIPILVDIDPRTYTIDPDAVEEAITPKTAAIVAVDLGGMPCDTDRLRQIADRHGVALVSDASHATGSIWRGKKAGAWADIAVYSIMSGKTFAVGEGGVICANDEAIVRRCLSYQHMGRTPGAVSPDHVYPATTLRLAEWEAAIGLCALERIDEQAETRDGNVRYLAAGLAEIPGLAGLEIDSRVERWSPFRWHFRFLPDEWDGLTRDQFRAALAAEGVPNGFGVTRPLYWFSYFRSGEWGPGGFPFHSPYNDRRIDYREVVCPETERIHLTEAVDLMHRFLLGPRSEMDLILAAMRKIRDNLDEARRIEATAMAPPAGVVPSIAKRSAAGVAVAG